MSKPELNIEWYQRQQEAWEVSCFDVCQTEVYKDWVNKNLREVDTEALETLQSDPNHLHFGFVRPHFSVLDKALNELGLDLKQEIEVQYCRHRTFGGTIVYGERFVGQQRKDKAWKEFVKKAVG